MKKIVSSFSRTIPFDPDAPDFFNGGEVPLYPRHLNKNGVAGREYSQSELTSFRDAIRNGATVEYRQPSPY